MTDKRTVRAVAFAAPAEHRGRVYRLTIACDGAQVQVTLAAFERGVDRPILFEMGTDPNLSMERRFRYRFDDDAPVSSQLMNTDFGNEGRMNETVLLKISSEYFTKNHAMLGQTMDQVKSSLGEATNADLWRPGAGAYEPRWRYGRLPGSFEPKLELIFKERIVSEVTERKLLVLPKQRLLFADVFQDETVEFSFATLSVAKRTSLATGCFPGASKD